MREINDKEFTAVSALESFARYQYALKRIADSELLYVLEKDEVFAVSEVKGHFLYPIWPFKQFVVPCMNGEWSEFNIKGCGLNEFFEETVPFIKENNYLINVFPIINTSGFVVNHEEFLRDLNEELEKYI